MSSSAGVAEQSSFVIVGVSGFAVDIARVAAGAAGETGARFAALAFAASLILYLYFLRPV